MPFYSFHVTSSCSMLTNILFLLKMCTSESIVLDENTLHRSRRQLLFPNQTLLQLNAGVRSPTPIKTINVNWVFQANFVLPWNRTQIPVDILYANTGYDGDSRKKRDTNTDNGAIRINDEMIDYKNDAKLYHFYKFVEDMLNGFNHNGVVCVMRALCQLGAEPLHSDDEEDLLYELASFVLNPTNDAENHESENKESNPYIEAYKRGQEAEDCNRIYEDCSISLVDLFSKLYDDVF